MRRPGQPRGDDESHDLDFLIHPAESLDSSGLPAAPRPAHGTGSTPGVEQTYEAGDAPGTGRTRHRRMLRRIAVATVAVAAVAAAAGVNASRADRHRPEASPSPAARTAPVAPATPSAPPVDDEGSAETLFAARFPNAEDVAHVMVQTLTTPGLMYSIVFLGDTGQVIDSHSLVAGKPYPFAERLAFGGAGSTSHAPLVLHAEVTGGAVSCPRDFAVRPGRLYTIGCTLIPQAGTGVVTFSVRTSQRMIASGSIVFAAH